MAKRSRKKKTVDHRTAPFAPAFQMPFLVIGMALLLAMVAFLAYWPSLKSGFVYDARMEILDEGFITSLSNLPAVLSLKVMGMNLILWSRPGQMLYLMLIAAVCGKEPFGYHLCSNLLHAANVALLFVLLCRLIASEIKEMNKSAAFKARFAAVAVTLIFALHPIAVESVAEISYSSSLLVTFFTLLALLAATFFRPESIRSVIIIGGFGALCASAAVTSKESGVTTVLLLIAYWFLFRRREARVPWLLFLSATTAVTAVFLTIRFLFAPPGQGQLSYLGGSFPQVFLIQPRLWVFMMGKLLWPMQLSADYAPADLIGPPTYLSLMILGVVVALQVWLVSKSRMGALGVAIYWLGLATVSNFIPLNRPVADRFYYLPLAGVAMQLLALLLMVLKSSRGFWLATVPLLGVILPLTLLTLTRETVFANEFSLWTDTLQVSPLSTAAHNGLGVDLFQKGKMSEGIAQFQKALEIDPNFPDAYYNLGLALAQSGQLDQAMIQFKKALEIDIDHVEARNSLGIILSKKGEVDEAITQYQKALALNPNYTEAYNNLGLAYLQKKQADEAVIQFQRALKINPDYAEAYSNLGLAFLQKKQISEAIIQFQKALKINPDYVDAHNNLGAAFFQNGQMEEAMIQFQEAVRLDPGYSDAQSNLDKVKARMRQGTTGK